MTSPKYRMRRDSEGAIHRVVEVDGVEGFEVRFTTECTGCSQHSEGYRMADPTGCHECGYTGKRRRREWVPFDFSDYLRREGEARDLRTSEACSNTHASTSPPPS